MKPFLTLLLTALTGIAASCSLFNPTRYITTPSDGQSVRGVQSILVEPPQNFTTDYVDFFINGAYVDRANSSPYKIEWDTRTVPNGTYKITVEIWSVSATMVTDTITVYVDN